MYLLQGLTHVLVYGMAGCAGQTHHFTVRENVSAHNLYDSEQQETAVNVSDCVNTVTRFTKFYAVEEDKGKVK